MDHGQQERRVMKAYSETSGKTYDSWDDLVKAEAHGFIVTAVISRGKKTWPWTEGLYVTKREAMNAKTRMRNRMKNHDNLYPNTTYEIHVRPLWKDRRDIS